MISIYWGIETKHNPSSRKKEPLSDKIKSTLVRVEHKIIGASLEELLLDNDYKEVKGYLDFNYYISPKFSYAIRISETFDDKVRVWFGYNVPGKIEKLDDFKRDVESFIRKHYLVEDKHFNPAPVLHRNPFSSGGGAEVAVGFSMIYADPRQVFKKITDIDMGVRSILLSYTGLQSGKIGYMVAETAFFMHFPICRHNFL